MCYVNKQVDEDGKKLYWAEIKAENDNKSMEVWLENWKRVIFFDKPNFPLRKLDCDASFSELPLGRKMLKSYFFLVCFFCCHSLRMIINYIFVLNHNERKSRRHNGLRIKAFDLPQYFRCCFRLRSRHESKAMWSLSSALVSGVLVFEERIFS